MNLKISSNSSFSTSSSFSSRCVSCFPVLGMMIMTITFISTTITATSSLDLGQCNTALGMQSGEIKDWALASSSSLDPVALGPACARIRTEVNGGAWCPSRNISTEVYEYLEIDLLRLKVITLVETQGRFEHGQGQEYTEQYRLEYRRETNGAWFSFKNRRGHEVFQGNINTHIAEMRDVEPAITARWLRFVPYSIHPKHICLRVELYGCESSNGVVAYNVREGDSRNTDLDFKDLTYDGTINNGYLSGGLGQLTDGEEGQSNFRLDPRGRGQKGYEWVGWKSDTLGSEAKVEIIFRFDGVRNFTAVRIHCNNLFTKDVRVFSLARVDFGGSEVVEYSYIRDSLSETERSVTIPLEYKIAQEIRIELYFDAKWILISEIQFESELVNKTTSSVVLGVTTTTSQLGASARPQSRDSSDRTRQRNADNINQGESVITDASDSGDATLKKENEGALRTSSNSSKSATVGVSTLKQSKLTKISSLNTSTDDTGDGSNGILPEDYVGIILGALAIFVLLLSITIIVVIIRKRKDRCFLVGFIKPGSSCSSTASSRLDPSHGSTYIGYPALHFQRSLNRPTPFQNGAALVDESGGSSSPTDPLLISTAPSLITPYATLDLHRLKGFNPQCPWSDVAGGVDGDWEAAGVQEFPRDRLKFVMSLGEGQFGAVYLCEVVPTNLGPETDVSHSESTERFTTSRRKTPGLVAVKMLHRTADEKTRMNFQQETISMSRLRHPNLVRLIGVCSLNQPYCSVIEYLAYGDLKQFLQRHSPEDTTYRRNEMVSSTLSYSCLIYLATQISAGMKYLESLSAIHKDLATRNCLIGDRFRVKISDFGTSRSLYFNDYYALSSGTTPLPIRWMSWDAIILERYTTKSDVWSFAVTLWEILTFAKEHPYSCVTDDELVLRCDWLSRAGTGAAWPRLEPPPSCPRELCDLMYHCWNREPENRPSFHEINVFLVHKNKGYNPEGNEIRRGWDDYTLNKSVSEESRQARVTS